MPDPTQQDFGLHQYVDPNAFVAAFQRKAQLQQEMALQQQTMINQGFQNIGTAGQTLYDRKKRVAQALSLGTQFDIPPDVAKTMDPDQILKLGAIKKGNIDMNMLINFLHPGAGGTTPQVSSAATTPTPAVQTSTPATPAPAPTATPIEATLASTSPTIPMPASPPGPLMSGTTTQAPVPVPIAAPPIKPRMVNPATINAAAKMGAFNRDVPVMTSDAALAKGTVPKGTVIKDEKADPSNYKSFIGNDAQGNPLFADKNGAITRGRVPSLPANPQGQPVPGPQGGGPVLPRGSTLPSAATRSSGEFAETLLPHIDNMRSLIQQADAKGYIGPGAGRVYGQFLAGKVGSTGDPKADKLLGQLRATDSLLKSAALRVHFGARGGSSMYDHFSDLLNTGKQSAAMLNGSLDGIQSFMEGYANAGNPYGTQIKPAGSGGLSPEEQAFMAAYEAKHGIPK